MLWGAFEGSQKHSIARLGASIAYYGVLSLAPLAVIMLAVVGLFFGQKAAQGLITGQLDSVLSGDAARAVQSMIASVYRSHASLPATILAAIVLVFSASRLIGSIRSSLNDIWEVAGHAGGGLKGYLVGKLIDLAMILGLAVLVLGTLLANTAVSGVTRYFENKVPFPTLFLQVGGVAFSFLVVTGFLSAIFRGLPNVRLSWRDVLFGAGVSAAFFEIGNYVIGLYLGRSSLSSVFGAAGSFAVLMIWMYYSAIVVLFGVEVTRSSRAEKRARRSRADATPETTEAAQELVSDLATSPEAEESPSRRLPVLSVWTLLALVAGFVVGNRRRSRSNRPR